MKFNGSVRHPPKITRAATFPAHRIAAHKHEHARIKRIHDAQPSAPADAPESPPAEPNLPGVVSE